MSSDYDACEALVSNAWEFGKNFKPRELADIARCIYTKGSVLGSNYRKIAEANGGVAGFLFGLNEKQSKPAKSWSFGFGILRRLLFLKGVAFKDKWRLLKAINIHEANRSKVVDRGKSEVVLFVVAPDHQGEGIGKRLLSGFIDDCRESGVESVIVETNRLGASDFYEAAGFKHIGDFHSPLHEYVTRDGQACMYEFVTSTPR